MQVWQGGRHCRPVSQGVAVFALTLFSSVCLAQTRPAGTVTSKKSHSISSAGAAPLKPAASRAKSQPVAIFSKLPLSFEANRGQAPAAVKYLTRGAGYTLYLTRDEAVLALASAAEDRFTGRHAGRGAGHPVRPVDIRMRLEGANREATVKGTGRLPGRANYFIGNDPKAWRTGIPTYAQVVYGNIYPGVDLVYYGRAGRLEYDFRLNPGAAAHSVGLSLAGVEVARVTADGDLELRLPGGEVKFRKPVAYQTDSSGARRYVAARYRLERSAAGGANGAVRVSFALEAYNHSRALVIDPALSFSSYLGGAGADSAAGVGVDAASNVYVTGAVTSLDFPVSGAYQAACGSTSTCADAFVTEISADGTSQVYSTYLGGSSSDAGAGIAVDASGEAFVTGNTNSTDFPTTAGSRQTVNAGGVDAFVTKLAPGGATLVYSTYVGGKGDDYGYGIALDASGESYVVGSTTSADFPVTITAFQTKKSNAVDRTDTDAFLDVLPPSGATRSVYTTYLGGTGNDVAYGVAVDGVGNAYVTGQTAATDFPVSSDAFQPALSGGTDAFVAEFAPGMSGDASLIYSTYLGGNGNDSGKGIAVDAAGNAYVAGSTASTNFPATGGAFQGNNGGGTDAFVSEVTAGGAALTYSTYAGGSNNDAAAAIALDAAGDAFVTGNTTSTDFPTHSAVQAACNTASTGCDDAFVLELAPGGASATYSTFLGGSAHDTGAGIALDAAGNAYVAGATNSIDFPVTPGAFQVACGSTAACGNAFVAKFGPSAALQVLPSLVPFGVQTVGTVSAPQTVTVTNESGATVTFTNISASSGYGVDTASTTCGPSNPLADQASCLIGVTFSPAAAGQQAGTLTLADDAAGSPQTVMLSGIGVTSVATLAPTSVAFGNQFVGTSSAPQSVTLTNAAATPLAISNIGVTAGSAFSETNNCGSTLAADKSCVISVVFSPAATGSASATLTVNDAASGSPQTASLTGTGVSSAVSLSATTLNFGSQIVKTASATPQSVSVTNSGSANLNVTGVSISGANASDFALASGHTCDVSLATGGSCTIQINFTPSGSGLRSATLSIADNAADSPQTVALLGTGSDFTMTASPASASVNQGSSASYTLSVSPVGGFAGTVALGCTGAPQGAACNLSLPSAVLTNGSTPVMVTVNVSTSAPGAALRWPWIGPHGVAEPVWLLLAGVGMLVVFAGRRMRRSCVMLATAILFVLVAASCGNKVITMPTAGTPFGSYTLTLTGSSNNLGNSTTVTLVVQ
jgi:Beta-propeller repeat/Cep192 domain 4/Abnormal spindle-like microcephaly-assoc'd, ASPM-SPD-2-Hydin